MSEERENIKIDEEELIDIVAKEILEKYRSAFEELAK